jgi:dynein heavy chain
LAGDISISSAFLSYCGPFNQDFRDLLIHNIWIKDLDDKKIPHSKNIDNGLIPFLTNDAEIG